MKELSEILDVLYKEYLNEYFVDFSKIFDDQIQRLNIKSLAERFFHSSEIPFVAIDGSCFKHSSSGFISLYGGAYGAKGSVSITGREGKVRYERWELSKDVSMVAFVPIPPDCTGALSEDTDSDRETPPTLTDSEIQEIASLHTKLMQLAEIYLAWSLANSSSVDFPRMIMLDNSISGILANSSFSPKAVRLHNGVFQGETIEEIDLHMALAHPFNKTLGIPSTKHFQPQYRVIAEAAWRDAVSIKASQCPDLPEGNFINGCEYLERLGGGRFDRNRMEFSFSMDPNRSWRKCVDIFSYICGRMFREKSADGLRYCDKNDRRVHPFFVPKDISFLIGVGLRSLIETCWNKNILLTGLVKDSNSRFFYRNYIGSTLVKKGLDPSKHLQVTLSDRGIVEVVPNLDSSLMSPWGTKEFDSLFMTIHPEYNENARRWVVKGYDHPRLGETTRPERIFLRSIVQFMISPDRSISSHALFLDRLAYPGWDDVDSNGMELETGFFGKIEPLEFGPERRTPRLQLLNMYLLSILVKNHFPQALGYPDPLYQADWGALSMERRVRGLLESSEWAFRANPLSRTFREIRDARR